ncbi:MAG: cysteine peptidase family C39 domain-containing protein, partial [Actinomycetota bacterium]
MSTRLHSPVHGEPDRRGETVLSDSTDTLLACLQLVALGHGRPLSRDAAVAGLPLVNGRLCPSLFARAAQRAGLSSRIAALPLKNMSSAVAPFIALLKDDAAVVVLAVDAEQDSVRLRDPATAGEIEWSMAQFAERYRAMSIMVRADFRFDERTPQVGPARSRHWFWDAMRDNWPLYRDALSAAALINA